MAISNRVRNLLCIKNYWTIIQHKFPRKFHPKGMRGISFRSTPKLRKYHGQIRRLQGRQGKCECPLKQLQKNNVFPKWVYDIRNKNILIMISSRKYSIINLCHYFSFSLIPLRRESYFAVSKYSFICS